MIITKHTLSTDCRLDRRNPQMPGVLGLSSKSHHFDSIVFVDWFVQYTTSRNYSQGLIQAVPQFFSRLKCCI